MTTPESGAQPAQPAQPKRSRSAKRSSLACAGCKQAKRKCDISQQPPGSEGCSNCRDKGESCEVRYGDDKRRRMAARNKSDVFDVESRLLLIEDLLMKRTHTQSPTGTRRSKRTSLNAGSPVGPASVQIASEVCAVTSPVEADQEDNLESRLESTASFDDAPTLAALAGGHATFTHTRQVSPPAREGGDTVYLTPGVSATQSYDANSDHVSSILDRVTSRQGALERQDIDHVKYFGPTGIFYLSTGTRTGLSSSDGEKTPKLSDHLVETLPDCDTSNEPEPIVMHLLDLFWTWQASHLQIFHRSLFLKEKKLYDTERTRRRYNFFSPCLLYAIMALASMISPDRGVRYQSTAAGRPVGNTYFEKSKRLLEKEIEHPSIISVQTALLIGSRYGALGQHSLGWTYSGIALRMSIELGLHIDCRMSVQQGALSPEMAEVRQLVFWGCYIQDKLWSAYCGRPAFIMDWDVTVCRPDVPLRLNEPKPDEQTVLAAVHQSIVLLTLDCSRILTELYSQKHHGDIHDLRSAAHSIHGGLLNWHRGLPEVMRWPNQNGAPTSPHVLLMHMQFYFTLILLYRPFINFGEAIASIHKLGNASFTPIGICTLAATNITKLTRDYSLFYNLKQISSPAVHFVFIAATIHLLNHQVAGGDDHKFLFQGCLSSLADIGESYQNAQKAVLFLQGLRSRFLVPYPHSNVVAQNLNRSVRSTSEDDDRTSSRTYSMQGLGEVPSLPLVNVLHAEDATRAGGSSSTTCRSTKDTLRAEASGVGLDRFDWSRLNSPVALPSGLNEIDLETYNISHHDLGVGDTGWYQASLDITPNTNILAQGYLEHIDTDFPATESGVEPSATLLGRFYGSAWGLNQL